MKLSLIAAVANNNVIGSENKLIWHLPADLKHFKECTMGHTVIMGRKTFDSIGKPLKGRRIIIITRNKDFEVPGTDVVHSIKDAISLVKNEKEVFVAGGSEIYRQFIDLYYTRRLIITRIYANFEGDAFFPEIDPEKWELLERQDHEPDKKNKYPFAFLTYKKKKSALCR